MTAPDPQRAVDEARERLYEAFRAFWNDEYWGLSCADAVADFEAAVRADERARLLATQDDADAQAPGYYTEGRRDP